MGFSMRRVGEESPKTRELCSACSTPSSRNRAQSQRLLASELGIALGLVNAYLKRCIKKGLVKVRSAPARRYAYYLTPQGFAEKSRLTVEYLSYSFGFFRQAKTDCSELFKSASARGVKKVVCSLGKPIWRKSRRSARWSTALKLLASCRRAQNEVRIHRIAGIREFRRGI